MIKNLLKPNRCLDCNQELSGRSDKKFCDDQCRINYHNTISKEKNKKFRAINSILAKNRNILLAIDQSGFEETTREKLLSMGFNFNYHTQQFKLDGKTFIMNYDYGLNFINAVVVKIIKQISPES